MGLFPCTFKHASSVVLTVALGLCAANVRATKIEFSVPTSEIDVPDQQKELKKEAKAELKVEISFKGGLDVGPTAAPVIVGPTADQRDAAALAKKNKAAQAAEAMRTTAQDSLSSTSWQMDRQSAGRDASREADSI